VLQFCNDYEMNGPKVAGLAPLEALHRLQKYQALCEERERKLTALRVREAMFDMSITLFPEINRVRDELDNLDMLYSLYLRSDQTITNYYEFTLTQIVSKNVTVTSNVTKFLEDMSELPHNLSGWPAYVDLKQTIEGIASIIPLLTLLSVPSIRPRHWRQVFSSVGANRMIREEKMRLKQFVALNPLQYTNEIEAICRKAMKEADEEAKLKVKVEFWTDQTFVLVDYKKKGLILEGKGLGDIIDRVEESLSTLSVIQKSQFSEPFIDEVSNWISKLSTVSEIVLLWSQVLDIFNHLQFCFNYNITLPCLIYHAFRLAKGLLRFPR
jgi:dynein heavy chain